MIAPLIFDLGMHTARDTDFYLRKGFRVVAVEASPSLANLAFEKYAEHIASGMLKIEQKALWDVAGSEIGFFLNPVKDDWSSAYRGWAEKGGHQVTEIVVPTTTLSELFEVHGTPYYVKCDIEGADEIFCNQLHSEHRRPSFVSVEAISLEIVATLYASGYDRFQIVNQALNWQRKSPNPAREGKFVDVTFDGHMSGLFGRELRETGWITFKEVADRYLRFISLFNADPDLAYGWLDIHATTRNVLTETQ